MKKTLITLFLLTISNLTFSQKSEVILKLEKKQKLNERFINRVNGDIYLRTSKQPSALLLIYKNNHLIKLNNNLEQVFDVEFTKSLQVPTSKFSGFNYLKINDKIIDSTGNVREYPKKGHLVKLEKMSNLNPIFGFFNNDGYTFIGPKIGRKNRKKAYDDDDLFIFNLKNSDLTGVTHPFKLENIQTNQKYASWFVLNQKQPNSFFLTSKDDLEENLSNDTYHFAEYAYNGSIISYTKIAIALENGKYFLPSHSDIGPTVYSNSAYGGSFGYASSYVNKKDNSILLYGYYSKKNEKQIRVGKVDGMYAHKYKIGTGELIWKTYLPFTETNSNYLIKRKIEYVQSKEHGVIHCYLDDDNGFFKINSETGKIEKNSSDLVSIFDKSKILRNDTFLRLNMYVGGYFRDTFKDKKTNRNNLTTSVLKAILLKPEIEGFLLNKSKELKFSNINAEIIENGDVYIIIDEVKSRDKKVSIYKF